MSERQVLSQKEKETEAAQIANAQVAGGMWNLNVTVFFYAVLVATLVMVFKGFAIELVASVAFFGLVLIWVFARVRYRKLYSLVYQDQLRRLQKIPEQTPPLAAGTRKATGAVSRSSPLTSRQVEILSCIANGSSNKEIAARLDLSEQTVKNQLRNIFDKLGAEDRTQAVLTAMRLGWLEVDKPPEQ